jgi:hypothetical protein
MELKKCPLLSGSASMTCLGSECNFMVNEECIFIGMARNLQVILLEANQIKKGVYRL